MVARVPFKEEAEARPKPKAEESSGGGRGSSSGSSRGCTGLEPRRLTKSIPGGWQSWWCRPAGGLGRPLTFIQANCIIPISTRAGTHAHTEGGRLFSRDEPFLPDENNPTARLQKLLPYCQMSDGTLDPDLSETRRSPAVPRTIDAVLDFRFAQSCSRSNVSDPRE